MDKQLYWCDVCYKNGCNHDGESIKRFFGCYSEQAYSKHCGTAKHKKLQKEVNEDPMSIECKHCNKKFSQVGYANHCHRNSDLWKWQKIGHSLAMQMKCNNFIVKDEKRPTIEKRYESIEAYKKSLKEKEPSKRAKVGERSPITNVARGPNKPYKKHKSNVSMEISNIDEDEPKPKKKDLTDKEMVAKRVYESGDGYYDHTIIKSYKLTEKDLDLLDMYDNQPDNIPLEECDECGYLINDYDVSDFFFTSHLGWEVCDCS